MQRPVVLLGCSSPSDSNITAWDLATATQLATYKANSSCRNGLCRLGQDYIAAAQTGKDAVQFWTWHKDQAVQRSFTVERILALAASLDGSLLAGGGASGSIHLWEVGSGRLLRSWSAHYKAVSALAFTESGGMLVSGGDDTLVHVWLLAELLDLELDPGSHAYTRPQPLHTWSDHTLPITSLHLGVGESTALVASASLDRTIKLHSLGTGRLLRSISLPTSLHSVVVDAGELTLWAGGGSGAIYEVSLLGGSSGSSSSVGGSAHAQSLGHDLHTLLEGHSRTVASLALALDGEHLVSGSDDGTARVWDLRSHQPIQVIHAPKNVPVTSVLVLPQPKHLSVGSGGPGRTGSKRMQPLAPLVKYAGMSGTLKAWEGSPLILNGGATSLGGWAHGSPWSVDHPTSVSSASRCKDFHHSSHSPGQLSKRARQLHTGVVDVQEPHDRAPGATTEASRKTKSKKAQAAERNSGSIEVLEAELAALRAELALSQAAVAEWRGACAELQKFAVESVAMQTG